MRPTSAGTDKNMEFVDSNVWLYALVRTRLLSEDMCDGEVIEGTLTIVNPFRGL